MSSASLLPSTNLGRWLGVVSLLAMGNSLFGMISTGSSRKSYSTMKGLSQVTPLQSRHYSCWTLTSGMVRLYTAYNIHSKELYQLCLATFIIVLVHIATEVTVYKTATLNSAGIISTLLVATLSLTLMLSQYTYYIPT